jgi:hypothetical protein
MAAFLLIPDGRNLWKTINYECLLSARSSRSRDKKNPAEAGFLDLNCKLSIRLSAGLWMTSPDFTSI